MARLLLLILSILPFTIQADVVFKDAWIKNLPPSVPVRAGYMSIENTGSKAVSILSVSSKAFTNIEVHETTMKDGMMHMGSVPELTINPHSTVMLQPGGMHLMMNPNKPTQIGDNVAITVKLSDGTQQQLNFMVKK